MKGSYILTMEMSGEKRIMVGKLGMINFNKGYYAYVGSALNGLEGRLKRHLSSEKKLYWHIDYLLEDASIREIFCLDEDKECEFARELGKKFKCILKFGSSDCKCDSHLFYSKNYSKLKGEVIKLAPIPYLA